VSTYCDLRPDHRNRLLDGLLPHCPGLTPVLDMRSEPAGTELYLEGGPMPAVYFPTGGVVSIVVRLQDGASADVLTIGNEGMVGVDAWLGLPTSLHTALQQAPGDLVRVPVAAFLDEVGHSAQARRLLDSYAAYCLRFGGQTCVCNSHHSVKQRLCRWLLTSADRADSNELALTQAMLASMMCVRRQSVNEVLAELQRDGAVTQQRNRIVIRDRAELGGLSCECYRATKALYARLVEPLL
jgi:CRP-like cAMP-binding protein